MNNILLNVVSIFSSTNEIQEKSLIEDFSVSKGCYSIIFDKIPTQEDFIKSISALNSRDYINISIQKDDEILCIYSSNDENTISQYNQDLKSEGLNLLDKIEITITISKTKRQNIISIYYIDLFYNYLESLDLFAFINAFEKRLNNKNLILEVQDGKNSINFFTSTISIIDKSIVPIIDDINYLKRKKILDNAQTLCHWDFEKSSLLPEDLFSNSIDNERLAKIFKTVSLLYTCIFIFDYSNINKKTFLYKINGFKTLGEEIKSQRIVDINIDNNSYNTFFDIYQLIYSGGNTYDRINIARNIISLNINQLSLQLPNTTIDAIKSNLKIFERENAKQYIEIRNKLSELMIDLQGKIGKIVDEFIGDFKKNIITFISFFISIIVIRVVSKGDFIGGFTKEIMILSAAFLLISVGLLIYSRWELKKKIAMFEKHYLQLKDRYKNLLSEDELKTIFDECDPQNNNTNKSFVKEQRKYYTILWVGSIIVLSIALIWISYINNII